MQALRPGRPSPQHRTGAGAAPKKGALSAAAPTRPAECHAAYERLREAAQAGAAPDQSRWGLALLTGRGLAAWIQAWAQAEPSRDDRLPAVRPPLAATAPGPATPVPSTTDSHLVPAELVAAMAGMILGALRREVADGDRTPES